MDFVPQKGLPMEYLFPSTFRSMIVCCCWQLGISRWHVNQMDRGAPSGRREAATRPQACPQADVSGEAATATRPNTPVAIERGLCVISVTYPGASPEFSVSTGRVLKIW